jgi:tetratricopeptide (TPR) repeat protein
MRTKIKYIITILLVFLFTTSATANLNLPRSVYRVVLKTQKAIKDKDFKKAESILSSNLKSGKKHYILHFLLGNVLSKTEKTNKAIEQYKRSIALNCSYAPAFQNIGTVYFNVKEYKKAGDSMLKVYSLSKNKDFQSLYYAAVSYFLADKVLLARPHLFFLISGKAGPPKLSWLKASLKLCIALKLYDKAGDIIEKLIVLNKNDSKLWRLITWFHLKRENYEKALTSFKIYTYLTPSKKESDIKLLGDLYSAIDLSGKAASYYEKQKTKNYSRIIDSYIKAYRKDKAYDVIDEAIKKKPDSKLFYLKGVLLFEKYDYTNAYKAFEKCTYLNQKRGKVFLLKGYCAIRIGKYEEAGIALKIAITFKNHRKQASELLKSMEQIKRGQQR